MLKHALVVAPLFAIGSFSIGIACGVAVAGEACLRSPDREANAGYRWHFRVDRVNHRHCWFQRKVPPDASAYEPTERDASPGITGRQSVSSWFSDLVRAFENRNPWIWEDLAPPPDTKR